MSAAELARQIDVPTNRVTAILNGPRGITGDTALRLVPLLRHERRILAQSAKPLRAPPGRTKGRESHQSPSNPENARTRACLIPAAGARPPALPVRACGPELPGPLPRSTGKRSVTGESGHHVR